MTRIHVLVTKFGVTPNLARETRALPAKKLLLKLNIITQSLHFDTGS
jgi:hypothetical protein